MYEIRFINRLSGCVEKEQVYGERFLHFLYGNSRWSKLFGAPLVWLISRCPFFSSFYGYLQSLPSSVKKIEPFIRRFNVDTTEFALPASGFNSFNDFFTRKLLPSSRPIHPNSAVIPADGRYLFYPDIEQHGDFFVKGARFNLAKLLTSSKLAEQYKNGSMVIARLCPTDYHRFHFPCECVPGESHGINGFLSSVNPIAIKKSLQIFWENKRSLCELETSHFGTLLFLEIGATCVGTIHQSYSPFKYYEKGDEKGFFSFGGSSLILIFPPHSIQFDADLLAATAQGLEIKCLMGQSMGNKISLVN